MIPYSYGLVENYISTGSNSGRVYFAPVIATIVGSCCKGFHVFDFLVGSFYTSKMGQFLVVVAIATFGVDGNADGDVEASYKKLGYSVSCFHLHNSRTANFVLSFRQ